MSHEESKQILEAVGSKCPTFLEAVAVLIENHTVGGHYAYHDRGQFWQEDSAGTALSEVAKLFRAMKK